MVNLGYYSERGYPYICSLVITIVLFRLKINISEIDDYKELLNGLVTLESIIIGFIGAIMPVILSMKNESKFVKYVFEKDKKNLFCKYLKSTILFGLLSASITLIMHIRTGMSSLVIKFAYYFWIYITVLFLILTYRSMSHMINLVFSKDDYDEKDMKQNSEEEILDVKMQEIIDEYKNPNI
jgi:hypothetical protein